MRAATLAACLLLSSCATTDAPVIVRTCPRIMPVTQAQRDALAGELARVEDDDILSLVVREWQGLRDQTRACQGAR